MMVSGILRRPQGPLGAADIFLTSPSSLEKRGEWLAQHLGECGFR